MQSKFITVGEQQYHFWEAGSGKKLLLALHGYGNDGLLFEPFVPFLQEAFTLVFLDLPHHGKTKWSGGVLTKKTFATLLEKLCEQYGVAKINLLGYSIGGRLSLCLLEEKPELVTQVVLVASDGLQFNPFYYFVTQNRLGKYLFKTFLSDEKYLRLFQLLSDKKLLHEKKYRFLMLHLQTAQQRNKLQNTWTDFSLLVPDKKKLKTVIKKHPVQLAVFMGANDVVIPPSKAAAFKNCIPDTQVHIINQGHRMFDDKSVPLIAQVFLAQ
jgi:pimeloyl-ACP methyl ester carboxylesterase